MPSPTSTTRLQKPIELERKRQQNTLEMIASENFVPVPSSKARARY